MMASKLYLKVPLKNNDVLSAIRYMLDISDEDVANIFKMGGRDVPLQDVRDYLLREEDPQYRECNDRNMAHFLDGFIIYRRGKEDKHPALPIELPMTNNIVLKKLRVAFVLREDDILFMLEDVGFPVGRAELSALFRRKDHQNYRECGDQLLRNFLKALTLRARG